MDWRDQHALVTGGLGLIGSAITRQLVAAGARVTAIDTLDPLFGGNRENVASIADRIDLHIADLADARTTRAVMPGVTHVFALAGQTSHLDSMQVPLRDLASNCAATLTLLDAVRDLAPSARVIFASTRQVYGVPTRIPVDENHPLAPPDVNAIHKIAAEQYHRLYETVYGVRSTVLRLTNVYGPGMRIRDARQTFVGIWIRNLIEGEPIRIFGDGEQRRDFTFVEDCAAAFLAAAFCDSATGRTFNVGGTAPVSLNELAELLIRTGQRGTIEHVPFPPDRKAIDIGDYCTDDQAFRAATGWSARTGLDNGLASTVAYYEGNLTSYL